MNDNLSIAIFGGFDGMCCVLGVLAAVYVTGDVHALLFAVVGLALSESIAMAGGSYLSELVNVQRVRHAAIIGVASAIGIITPALPFFFAPARVAILLSCFLTCALTVIIAQVRVKQLGALESYVQTFAIVLIAAAVSIVVTLLLREVAP